jgi:hypothetical protein
MLVDVVRRLAAIEDIVRPLQPMADQFPTLQRMTEQEQHQVILNIAVTQVENALRNQPPRGAPHHLCAATDEDDPGNDFIPTAHKLEFPKFDGTSDPLPWLNR